VRKRDLRKTRTRQRHRQRAIEQFATQNNFQATTVALPAGKARHNRSRRLSPCQCRRAASPHQGALGTRSRYCQACRRMSPRLLAAPQRPRVGQPSHHSSGTTCLHRILTSAVASRRHTP
jgi:hypothetical protein